MSELVNIQFQKFTGAGAIAETLAPGVPFRLLRIEAHWSAAPTTSENFTVTLDAANGATYDAVLTSVNPSTTSATSVVNTYGEGFEFEAKDEIDIAYANTDTRTIAGRIVYETPK